MLGFFKVFLTWQQENQQHDVCIRDGFVKYVEVTNFILFLITTSKTWSYLVMNSYNVQSLAREMRIWVEAAISEKEKLEKRVRKAGLRIKSLRTGL